MGQEVRKAETHHGSTLDRGVGIVRLCHVEDIRASGRRFPLPRAMTASRCWTMDEILEEIWSWTRKQATIRRRSSDGNNWDEEYER
jgi:hypothetical protein